jgi:hypothetical protein
MEETDKITQFIAHYENHFNILVCENFDNNKHYLKQEAVFSTTHKKIVEQFIDEHTLLVQRNYSRNFDELAQKPRPTNIRFTTICDGCYGCVVYNTVSCGEQCALLTMADRITHFKSSCKY